MSALLVGVAQVDYTPPAGLPLMGNFRDDYAARGVHDPLRAKAVVFEEPGGGRAALLAVDICMMNRANVAMMREFIASHCPLTPDRILIAATHTHSGPAPMGLGPMPESPPAETEAFLCKAAVAAVRAAEDLRPAGLVFGESEEQRLSYNRRLRCRDGQTHMNWERLDPSFVLGPLGPVDPRVAVLQVARKGHPVANLVNFGLHPAILAGDNWLYSADYPGYLAEAASRLYGEDFRTLFFNSACGDINHIDYTDLLQGRGYQTAQRVGYMLAVAAHRAAGEPVAGVPIAVSREQVRLNRIRITEDQRRWSEEVLKKLKQSGSPGQVDGVPDEYYARTWLEMCDDPPDDGVEVMVVRLGDIGIVGLPGEIFCELGMDIRRRSPAKHTLVFELANDAIGYIPTRRAYEQGGYEVSTGATRYQPGCGETLVDSAVRQLEKLFGK